MRKTRSDDVRISEELNEADVTLPASFFFVNGAVSHGC